jgi:TRAP-type mannitol/chloroaromatic compound transport system permease small subunit
MAKAGSTSFIPKQRIDSVRAIALIIKAISSLNTLLGQVFSWFTLGIVLVCFTVVVLRYVFSIGFVWMQDLYVWMNGIMFTGIAGFVLLREGHVRVDIFYRPAQLRRKAWIDLIGTLVFLAPFTYMVTAYSWAYVARSWRFNESSGNIGGMPGLYILKSFIIVFAVVVALQGVAMALRSLLVLMNREDLLPPALRYQKEG